MWVDMWFLESWLVMFLYVGAIFPKTMISYLENGDSRFLQTSVPIFFLFSFEQQSNASQGLLIHGVSRSHTTMHHNR